MNGGKTRGTGADWMDGRQTVEMEGRPVEERKDQRDGTKTGG